MKSFTVALMVLAGCVTARPAVPPAPAPPPAGYPGDAPLLHKGDPAPFDAVALNDSKAREWYAAPKKCEAELDSYKVTNALIVGGLVAAAIACLVLGFEVGREVK